VFAAREGRYRERVNGGGISRTMEMQLRTAGRVNIGENDQKEEGANRIRYHRIVCLGRAGVFDWGLHR
jgi:hypothetical protein